MELVHQDFLVWLSGSIGIEERAIMERINERLVMAGDLLHDQEALNEAFAAGVRRYGRQIDAEAWQAFLHGAEPTSDMLRRLGMLATDEETQPWPAPDSNLS
jgi:hypothetical protein